MLFHKIINRIVLTPSVPVGLVRLLFHNNKRLVFFNNGVSAFQNRKLVSLAVNLDEVDSLFEDNVVQSNHRAFAVGCRRVNKRDTRIVFVGLERNAFVGLSESIVPYFGIRSIGFKNAKEVFARLDSIDFFEFVTKRSCPQPYMRSNVDCASELVAVA